MFNLSTQDVVLSIENAPLVNLDGIYFQEYQNFFGNNFVFPDISQSEFSKLEMQEDFPRRVLSPDDILKKKLQIFFMNKQITSALSDKFQLDLKFASLDVWQDFPGYHLPPHTDNKRIKLALQIYIGEHDVGTSLFDSKDHLMKTFEFIDNSGYALLNNEISRHGTSGHVNNGIRTSIYVRYT